MTSNSRLLIKFWSNSCGICKRMSHYDSKVAAEEGVAFMAVQQGSPEYDFWLSVAEPLYDDPRSMGHPTYILVEGNRTVGELIGGSDKGRYRRKLRRLLEEAQSKCRGQVTGMEVVDGRLCAKKDISANRKTVTIGVKSQCCEPNNGQFRFWDWTAGGGAGQYVNMHNGMAGVSFPGDGGQQDWGDGPEIKQVKIDLATFKWDIADAPDGEFRLRWNGRCDQEESEGEEFQQTGVFKASPNCVNVKCKSYDVSIAVDNNNPKIGETINLTASVNGVPNNKCDYQWYSGNSSDSDNKLKGETNKKLTYVIPNKDAGKTVRFTCVVNISAEAGCEDEISSETTAFKVKDQECNDGVPCSDPCQECKSGKCQDKCKGDTPRCKDGKCYECTKTGHCDTKNCQKCQGNKCVNKCGPNQKCDGEGNCVDKDQKPDPPDDECGKDGDCKGDCKECKDGKCVDKCKGNTPYCKDGKCVECKQHSHCPDGKCCNNECKECCDSKHCPGDQVCKNGKCIDGPDCTSNDDCDDCQECKNGKCKSICKGDEICINGKCADPCLGVICDPGQICEDGVCVDDPNYDPCKDIVCPEGQECVDGICVDTDDDPCKNVICPDGSTGAGPATCIDGKCVCDDPNAIFAGGECICDNGFEWDEDQQKCVSDGGGDPENPDKEDPCFGVICTPPKECVDGECVCPDGTVEDANGLCVDPDKCKGVLCPPNAECIDGVCVCEDGYVADENGNCVMSETDDCEERDDCCPSNATICIKPGTGLGGGGCFTLNQICDKTIMLFVDTNPETGVGGEGDDCDEHGLQQVCACTKEIQMLTDMITSLQARIEELEEKADD